MSQEFIDRIIAFIKAKGWPIAIDCPLIVYIENCDEKGNPIEPKLDRFDDWGLLIDPNTFQLISQDAATTMYGKEAISVQMPKGGAARICLGYHEVWQVGFHKSNKNHPALVQRKPIRIQRDVNGDGERSGDPVTVGIFGLNQHTTGRRTPALIGPWSYGCLVRQVRSQHLLFIKRIMESERYRKNKRAFFPTYIINIKEI